MSNKMLIALLLVLCACEDGVGPSEQRFLGRWDMVVNYSGRPMPDTVMSGPNTGYVWAAEQLVIFASGATLRAWTSNQSRYMQSDGTFGPLNTNGPFEASGDVHGDTLYLYHRTEVLGTQPDKLVLRADGTLNTVCRGIYHSDCLPEQDVWRRRP